MSYSHRFHRSVFSSCNNYCLFQSNMSETKVLTVPGHFLRRGCLKQRTHTEADFWQCFSFGRSLTDSLLFQKQQDRTNMLVAMGVFLVSDTTHGPGSMLLSGTQFTEAVSKPVLLQSSLFIVFPLPLRELTGGKKLVFWMQVSYQSLLLFPKASVFIALP